jgi:hypothetical protein
VLQVNSDTIGYNCLRFPPCLRPFQRLSCAAADQKEEKQDRDWDLYEPQKNPSCLSALSDTFVEILHIQKSLKSGPLRVFPPVAAKKMAIAWRSQILEIAARKRAALPFSD